MDLTVQVTMVATAAACLLVLLVTVGARSVQPAPKEVEIDPYVFEQNILNLLEDLRNFLRNENLDPLVLGEGFAFDFYLKDTRLDGGFDDLVFTHVSDYNITTIALGVFPGIKLTMSPEFQILNVTGRYHLDGEVFGGELPIAGTGQFKSDVSTLFLDILIDCSSRNGSLWIKDFTVDFTLSADEFYYTNERDGTSWTRADNIIEILNRVRFEYFPLVEHTLTAVANDLLVGFTPGDLIDLITGHQQVSVEDWHQLFNKLIPMFIFNQHQ